MGVENRIEGELVVLRFFERVEPGAFSWTEAVRTAAEQQGGPVLVLCQFDPGLDLPIAALAAGARQTLSVLSLMRAVALVAAGERERTMLRVSVLAVRPSHPVEFFEDPNRALAWLRRFQKSEQARIPAA